MTISPSELFYCEQFKCKMLPVRCKERRDKAKKLFNGDHRQHTWGEFDDQAGINQSLKYCLECTQEVKPVQANPIKNQPEMEKEVDEMEELETFKPGKIKEKTCSRPECGKTYPLTEEYWHRNKDTRDGFDNRCKNCKNIMGRASYKNRMADRNLIKKKIKKKCLAEAGLPGPEQKAEDWIPDEKDRDLTGLFLPIGDKDIMAWLKKEAEAELRTPQMQALWIVRQHLKVREMRNSQIIVTDDLYEGEGRVRE